MSNQSVNPRTGEKFGPVFAATTPQAMDSLIAQSVSAYKVWSHVKAAERGKILLALAQAIDDRLQDLVDIADLETGLGKVRLTGEVGRTTFQIRSFSNALERGEFVTPSLDEAVDAAVPQGHPKFLRTTRGIGPVAIFGASNFPFAFSTLGGDTASALAAGCSVVIKAHPAHPQTAQLTFDIAKKALQEAGAPEGLISLGHGFEFGKLVITDPRISAGAFTGSRAGGRALFDLAQSREYPIPFYGELGSVNPVVAVESALTDPAAFAGAYLDSLLMGNGQFCTNPSVLFVPAGSIVVNEISKQIAQRDLAPFLSEATKNLHDSNRAKVIASTKAEIYEGKAPSGAGFFSAPMVLVVKASDVTREISGITEECFGPTGVVVTYGHHGEVVELLSKMEGALASSLFASASDSSAPTLIEALASMSGRVAFNAWPTGVAVTAGQHHGGPYPASTSSLHTSVGTQAINRFLRPVTFQGLPDEIYSALQSTTTKEK
ncbi:unannotated protein [freshwater metagenome]|uniref:Unannotated protein n=1 Tax=freshwater metagenome TaxID=449393 RepID=A0A6J6VAA2_9ZZZZ|nr:aldehyde dehydrogenase family protein [Actinomycetota bacterium]MSW57282.1 aldehyde dehydrogenase family protein [Actinomycetota bacterium]MSX47734.1 aldehyde dehydrogenase family protein [Actinomycetota bacterium]MSX61807.1 aldehyde dehydrogenase family protein [Actinomycetota bacterium]MSY09555.1 aldehyde dehydrogenase family protein [Actinomycetota bacterium]